ncbi:MAG: hypothetical protein A2Z06_01265 [Candidatus Glassbacteria bacterium RBG_16_58_8]|uniref:tetrahydrofolate synthase n=1 Tax=Candidatus Glassbacteria bacterium RBG_16_58_8 TaxID=1817866 RepID=A0A1F5YAL9_9BACT|nr:MAG: hypothetical protein A2Z06_01265 [Candidatus Glassbacteria bacterium RBG_16_58_8]
MNFREAYRFITSLKRFGGGRGLDAIERSLASIGNPQLHFPSIHVAGTNGKGTVSTILETVLRLSGLRVGLYTSPHLLRINERIRIDGKDIEEDAFARLIEDLSPIIQREGLTAFEALTLAAFKAFGDEQIDIGVIEVGLGGRLDATNLLRSSLTAITTIDRDHTAYLGESLREIAMEKLGILKKGVPLITGVERAELRDTFDRTARVRGVPIHYLDDEAEYRLDEISLDGIRFFYRSADRVLPDLFFPLTGPHQARNAALAVRALELMGPPFGLKEEIVRRGLGAVVLPGRFQVVRRSPYHLICDVFHNPHGADAVRRTLSMLFPGRSVRLIIGMAGDKDLSGVADALSPLLSTVITVKSHLEMFDRDIQWADPGPVFRERGLPVAEATSMTHALALAASRAKGGDIILVGGSFRTVAGAILHLKNV